MSNLIYFLLVILFIFISLLYIFYIFINKIVKFSPIFPSGKKPFYHMNGRRVLTVIDSEKCCQMETEVHCTFVGNRSLSSHLLYITLALAL